MKKLQNRKGFTLVELLIVMAIIGILIMIAIPRFTRSTQSATLKTVQSNVRTLVSAAGIYYADKNEWPASIQNLVDGKYVDANTFSGSNIKPTGTIYSITKADGGAVTSAADAKAAQATITLDQLEATTATDPLQTKDYTVIASGGAVTVRIPFAQ